MRQRMFIAVAGLVLVAAGCSGSSLSTRTASSATTIPVTTIPVTTVPGTTGTAGFGTGSVASPPTVPTSGGASTTTVRRPVVTTAVATTVASHSIAGSGVRGTVTAGPTCPVERAGMPCPPKPVVAALVAHDAAGSVVASTTSDAAGNFAMSLPPGQYSIGVGGAPTLYPRCQNVSVTVLSGLQATADIGCDTGIR